MAKFEFDLGPVQKMLEELGDIDEVAPRMLRRVGPIAKAAIQGRLKKHSRTGGWYIIVGFRGYDENGHPNDVKAAGLEYGNSHQQPEPFLDAAAKDCEVEVVDAMQAEYNLWLKEKGLVK